VVELFVLTAVLAADLVETQQPVQDCADLAAEHNDRPINAMD
jgi:hypothetical protein